MPRVCLLFEYPTLNGGERSILAVLDEVRREGFEIAALVPTSGPLSNALRAKEVKLTRFAA